MLYRNRNAFSREREAIVLVSAKNAARKCGLADARGGKCLQQNRADVLPTVTELTTFGEEEEIARTKSQVKFDLLSDEQTLFPLTQLSPESLTGWPVRQHQPDRLHLPDQLDHRHPGHPERPERPDERGAGQWDGGAGARSQATSSSRLRNVRT